MFNPHRTTCPKLAWRTKKVKQAVECGWGWPILPKSPYTNKTPLGNVKKLFFLSQRNAIHNTLNPLHHTHTHTYIHTHTHHGKLCQEILDLIRSCLRTMQGALRVKAVHVGHCRKRALGQTTRLGTRMTLEARRRMARVYLQTEIRLENATVNYFQK